MSEPSLFLPGTPWKHLDSAKACKVHWPHHDCSSKTWRRATNLFIIPSFHFQLCKYFQLEYEGNIYATKQGKDHLKNGVFCEWCISFCCRKCCSLPWTHQLYIDLSQTAKRGKYWEVKLSCLFMGLFTVIRNLLKFLFYCQKHRRKILLSTQIIEGSKKSRFFIKSKNRNVCQFSAHNKI